MNRLWVLLSISALVSGAAVAAPPRASNQDAAVLSVLIRRNCAAATASHHMQYEVVPNESVSISGGNGFARSLSEQVDPSAAQSLVRRNKVRHPLPKLPACRAIKIVPASELSPFPGWRSFYKLFPGAWALTTLSLPGYSSNGKVAIVQYSSGAHTVGGVGGGLGVGVGEIVVLHKIGKKWVITQYIQTSIS
jgi:hypothetical protein